MRISDWSSDVCSSDLEKFKAKCELPFTLASDEDGKVCEAYGTWVEKSLYGRKYMGIDRATFLIDEKGVVRGAWRQVKVKGHVEEVLAEATAQIGRASVRERGCQYG